MKFNDLKHIAEAFSFEKLIFIVFEIEQNNLASVASKFTEVQELYQRVLDNKPVLQNIIENLDISDLEKLHSKAIELNIELLNFQTKSIKELSLSLLHFSTIDKITKSLNSISNLIFKEINLREINHRKQTEIAQQNNIAPTPVVDWEDYEKRIYKKYKTSYPEATIIYDAKVDGKFSETERQIDILIEQIITDEKIRLVVECKYYSKKIDVELIESFITKLEQVKANKGIFITNLGFTKGALNTAKAKGIILKVIPEKEIENYRFDFDDFVNYRIQHLKLTKKSFLDRQKFNTPYIDSDRTSFEKKQIVYKEGYTNTEYFAYKRLLENGLRTFRDFPEIQNIKIITIANKTMANLEEVKYLYWVSISLDELVDFCKVDVSFLRKDIKIWREEMPKLLTKNTVFDFAVKFIKAQLYSEENLDELCK